jgi:hypothetical protein
MKVLSSLSAQHSVRPGRLTNSPARPDVASLIRDAGRLSTEAESGQ